MDQSLPQSRRKGDYYCAWEYCGLSTAGLILEPFLVTGFNDRIRETPQYPCSLRPRTRPNHHQSDETSGRDQSEARTRLFQASYGGGKGKTPRRSKEPERNEGSHGCCSGCGYCEDVRRSRARNARRRATAGRTWTARVTDCLSPH